MARAKKKQQADAVTEEVAEAEAAQEEVIQAGEELAVEDEALVTDDAVSEAAVAETPVEEEIDPDAPVPEMTQEDVRLVEAILFATSSAISVSQIGERFPAERKALIPIILEHLQAQFANRGINLVQRDGRWALRTATDLGDRLRLEKEQPKKFTRSAMETMAIIAYHQPVTRAEIENIRGVATSPGALDALMEAGWIKPGKRREVPGRPVTWLSTQAFLDHFGLEKLEDLPGMEELKAAGLLDKRPAVEAMPTADLFDENENKQEQDPQEVTDEDLVGKVTEEGGSADDLDVKASADDAEVDSDADADDEELDDDDLDEDDADDEDASDEDDELGDSEEDDSDDYSEDDDEESDDDDDDDDSDDDEDDEEDDDEDEE